MWSPGVGLHPIDLDAATGEFVALQGRSGSGKSTLLAIIAGWCSPDSGTVEVCGRAPGRDDTWELVAVAPQARGLLVELSVREHVTDTNPNVDAVAVDAMLAELHLIQLANRSIEEISMGQRQRLAIARAEVTGAATPLVELVRFRWPLRRGRFKGWVQSGSWPPLCSSSRTS